MRISLGFVVCVLASTLVAHAQVPLANWEPNSTRWLVEFQNSPVSEGGNRASVRNEHQSFRAAARNSGISFTERIEFENLFNGISIEVSAMDINKISALPNVKAVYPVQTYSIPITETIAPELATAITLTGADIVQSELGFTGKGVKVGIIDTGIDYNHPDLGGGFGPGFRVATGWDFVGDNYASSASTPAPDPYPDDCAGHGTHVAGIVGANGLVKGVAPEVTFAAYRVFGCTGSTGSDIIIQALERALQDGVDVVNMSLGSDYMWPQTAEALVADRLVNHGVVVVASIGNAGATGLYSAGAPGTGSKVIGVASFDNTYIALSAFSISPDGMKIGYSLGVGAPPAPFSGSYPMGRTGTSTTVDDACAALPAGSLTGRVALIRRGTCGFYVKAANAQNAGAAAVVLYNNVAGALTPLVTGTPPITIPVVAISAADGVLINSRLASGPVTLTWTNQTVSSANATGGLISAFSSIGLAADLSLKPDIGAPGGFIRSTYPIELGSYTSMSGTSMASPHVAGAVALLLEARPHMPSQAVNAILQNNAVPAPWAGNPTLGFLDAVQRQGAGMLRIDRAITATSSISPGKLALGESQAGPAVRTITINNNSDKSLTYTLSHAPARATGPNTFTVSYVTGDATLAFSSNSVVIPAGGSASVTVTITANASLADRSIYGGYIVISDNVGHSYRVPYAGFKGDYQSIQVLAPTASGFPWLAKFTGSGYTKVTAGASYTMVGSDVPYFILHLDHQSRRLRMEVFDANTGRAWHRSEEDEYLPRNSAATSAFLFAWDGTTVNGKKTNVVPNGSYVIKLTVLKALGDDSNPADVETWTSPVITLARP